MNSILRITDPIPSDNGIDRYEDIAYEPVAGTNLNASGQDIRLTIETQDIFTHPSESYLIIEGRLIKDDNNSYGNNDLVSITNNGMIIFLNVFDMTFQVKKSKPWCIQVKRLRCWVC